MVTQSERVPPAAKLASFIADLKYPEIPREGIRTAERAFVDTAGVTVAGKSKSPGTSAMEIAIREPGDVTLIGGNGKSSLFAAVFANATSGHALDFDDTALAATDGHPSVPMVAPLLAIGEQNGVSGRELLTAYISGFETQAYLNAPITPGHYEGGWHATATLGTFGAAAATAKLLDLPSSSIAHALNIAASMPAGLKRNFGSDTKPVHAGHAARAGTTAALLAGEDVDANEDAIGGEKGFFDLYRGNEAPDSTALYELGDQWRIVTHGIDIKKYACCYYTHAAIYGTEVVKKDKEINPATVEQVRILASQGAADAVQHDNPISPTQAKFSMPYLIAYTLINGTVDLRAFKESIIHDQEVQALRERITFDVDSDRLYNDFGATIEIELTDGSVYKLNQDQPPGTHTNPLSDTELREKFEMCMTTQFNEPEISEIYDLLDSLREVDDISEITALL